jgi:hypothetical protein
MNLLSDLMKKSAQDIFTVKSGVGSLLLMAWNNLDRNWDEMSLNWAKRSWQLLESWLEMK